MATDTKKKSLLNNGPALSHLTTQEEDDSYTQHTILLNN